jgi:hypothetical protein
MQFAFCGDPSSADVLENRERSDRIIHPTCVIMVRKQKDPLTLVEC